MKKFIVILLAGAFVMLAGCNTVAGIGKDVQAGGRVVEKAAEDVKSK